MPKRVLIIFLLASLYFCNLVFSDTIILKSGKTVEGKLIEETDAYIKIDYMGVPLTYSRSDVGSIEKTADNLSPADVPVLQKQQKPEGVNIKLKSDSSERIKKFIDKLDLLGQDITAIFDKATVSLGQTKDPLLNDTHKNIIQKAIDAVNGKIAEIKKLSAPYECESLQKFSVEIGQAETKKFANDTKGFISFDELEKYGEDYEKRLSDIRERYNAEKQKILEKINKKTN